MFLILFPAMGKPRKRQKENGEQAFKGKYGIYF